jgi:flagellin-like protein
MKSFRRNIKAISPIFATLILIAIAVIAGIVVYVFVSGAIPGLTGGTAAGQEKVSVQGVSISEGSVTVYAQSTNNAAVTITSILVKNAAGTTVGTLTVPAGDGDLLATGALKTITVTSTTGATAGDYYSVTLVSTKGGSFSSSQVQAT